MEDCIVAEDGPTDKGLVDTFKLAAEADIQNKEVAALMGEVDEESPGTLPGGLISRLGLTESKLAYSMEEKRKKGFRDWLFREAVRRSLEQINRIIGELQKRIEELLERMAETEERLSKLDEQYEILEAELEYFQEQGLFDCDKNGCLRSSRAETILTDWEQTTGLKIDRSDPASYETILNILVGIEQRRIALRHGMKNDAAEYERRKQQLDEALQIRDDLRSGDRVQNQKALVRFDGFYSDFENGSDNSVPNKIGVALENDHLAEEAFDKLSENLADGLSFGFPPIKENFAQAVSEHGTPPDKGVTKTDTFKSPIPAVNPKS